MQAIMSWRALALAAAGAAALATVSCGSSGDTGADAAEVEVAPATEAAALGGEAALAAEEREAAIAAGAFARPIAGLTRDQLRRFEAGRVEFETPEDVDEGLGPVFNDVSCVACHSVGGTGGGSNVLEARFGRRTAAGFDPLEPLGGSLIQVNGSGREGAPRPGCNVAGERVPRQANVTALRRTTPLFGLGLVDAVPDDAFRELERRQRRLTPATAGRVSLATNRANQQPAVARFGWKAQVQTLFEFSANAYLNEMGITSPLFPLENCPNGDPENCPLLERCNPLPGINDDGEGVVLFHDFMTFLAPPPRGKITPEVIRGEAVFARVGCADCHVPTLRTGRHPVAALSQKTFSPYSDFLLHDMGALADGIGGDQADASGIEAVATGVEMRTQPLWGLRLLDTFLHDGRARTLEQAILAHDGQGARARDRFRRLSREEASLLLTFLRSL